MQNWKSGIKLVRCGNAQSNWKKNLFCWFIHSNANYLRGVFVAMRESFNDTLHLQWTPTSSIQLKAQRRTLRLRLTFQTHQCAALHSKILSGALDDAAIKLCSRKKNCSALGWKKLLAMMTKLWEKPVTLVAGEAREREQVFKLHSLIRKKLRD